MPVNEARLPHGILRLMVTWHRSVLSITPDKKTEPVAVWQYDQWHTAEAQKHFEVIKQAVKGTTR